MSKMQRLIFGTSDFEDCFGGPPDAKVGAGRNDDMVIDLLTFS